MKNKVKLELITSAVIREDPENGEDKTEAQVIVFDTSEPPELSCPLCGQFAAGIDNRGRGEGGPIIYAGRPCNHLLFVGAYQKFNGQFGVTQPRLREAFEKLKGTPPPDQIVSKLKLDPENTLIICLQVPYDNMMDNADLVVGFDFTPDAEESEPSTMDKTI